MGTRHDFELDSAAVLFEHQDGQPLALVALDSEDDRPRITFGDIVGTLDTVESATTYTRAPYVARGKEHQALVEQANAVLARQIEHRPSPTVYRVRITATVEALSPEESAAAIKAARDREIRLEAEWHESITKGGE